MDGVEIFQIFLVMVGKLGIDLLHPPVGNHIFTGSPEWKFDESEIFFYWLTGLYLIAELTWCRSRRLSSLSPRQGPAPGPGGAGPAPGSPGRA